MTKSFIMDEWLSGDKFTIETIGENGVREHFCVIRGPEKHANEILSALNDRLENLKLTTKFFVGSYTTRDGEYKYTVKVLAKAENRDDALAMIDLTFCQKSYSGDYRMYKSETVEEIPEIEYNVLKNRGKLSEADPIPKEFYVCNDCGSFIATPDEDEDVDDPPATEIECPQCGNYVKLDTDKTEDEDDD